jgi:16S rRNA (cytosine1402-N4)-methyltransferase
MVYHEPVLLRESIGGLNIRAGGTYVDATYGGGGHSRAILGKLKGGRLLAFDQDEDSFRDRLDDERLVCIRQSFRYLRNFLLFYNAIPVDGILADLGISSHQLDEAERGFSFRFEGALDLRMDRKNPLDASKIINEYSGNKLEEIFRQFGEVENPERLAGSVVEARSQGRISTTGQLVKVMAPYTRKGNENQYYAKVFQALRIEVNDELGALKDLLKQSAQVLKKKGRLVVISYHSLEDRLVKNFMRTGSFSGESEKDFFGNILTEFRVITRRPVTPGEEEIARNSRARSAKLRIAEKL